MSVTKNVEVFWGGEWIKPLSVVGWPEKKSDKGLAVHVIDRRGRKIVANLNWRTPTTKP